MTYINTSPHSISGAADPRPVLSIAEPELPVMSLRRISEGRDLVLDHITVVLGAS